MKAKHLACWLTVAGWLFTTVQAAWAEKELAADSPPMERLRRVPPLAPEASRQAIQTVPVLQPADALGR